MDLLRVIFALLVASRHVLQLLMPREMERYPGAAHMWPLLCVPFFFLSAGYYLFRKIPDGETGRRAVPAYCARMLRLYLVWTAVYLPLNIYNYRLEGSPRDAAYLWFKVREFVFSSWTVHLWYLPGVAAAVFLVWLLRRAGAPDVVMLLITGGLFLLGFLMDNRDLYGRLPGAAVAILEFIRGIFMTGRNGIFFGAWYTALGSAIARNGHSLERRLVPAAGAVSAALGLVLMRKETYALRNMNISLFAALAVPGIFVLALAFERAFPAVGKSTAARLLRGTSKWIYFLHIYFIYMVAWLSPYLPFTYTFKRIFLLALLPVTAVGLFLSFMEEVRRKHAISQQEESR